jgi:hypothetical protein
VKGIAGSIDQFSSFVMDLHPHSLLHGSCCTDPVALFQWRVGELARAVDADCSGGGWAISTAAMSIAAAFAQADRL